MVLMPRPSRRTPNQLRPTWPVPPPSEPAATAEDASLGAASALAQNLSALRAQQNVSQAAVAARAGVSERSVRKIERGEVWPDLDTVARLAYALNVTASALLCEPDKRRH